MGPKGTFRYQPLSLYRPQIRLLRLSLGPSDSSIQCRMQHFDFEHKPPYHALSYTWGPNHHQETITVNSQDFNVSPNLFCFLALAPDNGIDRDTYLWIDQICIDQSEDALEERADQVDRMDRVYKEATQVDIWLGLGDPDMELLMDLAGQPAAIDATNGEHQRALDAFHRLPYWGRAWVVQEMYFARRLRFVYGTRSATGEQIDKLDMSFLGYTYGLDRPDGFTPDRLKNSKVMLLGRTNNLSFLTSSHLIRQKCGRVHDRIYAFQSFVPADARIKVDYRWTPLQLFNALVDNLAERADDGGLSDIETFATRLDVLPSDFSRALRRLNRKIGNRLSREEVERRERCYKEWAPRLNPACRSEETLVRRMLLRALDARDLIQDGQAKPDYPSAMFWMLRYDDND